MKKVREVGRDSRGIKFMMELEQLREECLKCRRCRIGGVKMDEHISNVFSTMNGQARVMVVGQNPGREEVAKGEPFVGSSGKFFDRATEEVLGMGRRDFYISNTVKCFTPGNRAPSVAEKDNCREFIDREIKIVRPKVVVTLGSPAFKAMTGMSGITKHHGIPIYSVRHKVNVLPLFHPSPLNMNSKEKRQMFYTGLKKLKEILDECDSPS